MSGTESGNRPPLWTLSFQDTFKEPSVYNDSYFKIILDGEEVGHYGRGVLAFYVNFIPREMLEWLAREMVCLYQNEIGYIFMLRGFPILRLIGERERKNFVAFRIKEMLRLSPYYTKVMGSNELLETVPFSPLDMKET